MRGDVNRFEHAPAQQGACEVEPITFIVAVNDRRELEENLLASPVARSKRHQWILVENSGNHRYRSISKLYAEAATDAENDLVFFMHQDLYLPETWEAEMSIALKKLEQLDPQWGVIGAVGAVALRRQAPSQQGVLKGHWHDPNGTFELGPLPAEVEALDEQWLGVRASRGPAFDPDLPGFHCYGIDLSLTARDSGMRSYAIDVFVWHKYRDAEGRRILSREDSRKILNRDTEEFRGDFRISADYVERKWRKYLPFQTTSWTWRSDPSA